MLYQNPQLCSGTSLWQKANKAAANYIGAVIDAFLCMLPISGPAALLAAQTYVAAVYQGFGVVMDSKRRKIAPAFRGVLFAPVTTCDQVSHYLLSLLTAVESEIASAHVEKAAKHQALCLSHAEQSKTLEADLKATASQAARHSALLIALAAHDLKEPRKGDFRDVAQKQEEKVKRLASLKQARAQAKAAGDIAAVKLYDKQIQAVRREEVLDYATAHRRWKLQRDTMLSEIARSDGVFEHEQALRQALAEHLAHMPTAPVKPLLVYRNMQVGAISKAHAQSPVPAVAIFNGSSTLKSLRKQREGILELLTTARSPFSILAAAPMSDGKRDAKALDANDASWLSRVHVVSDAFGAEAFPVGDVYDPIDMSEVESHLVQELRKQFSDDFVKQEVSLAPDAERLLSQVCENLRMVRNEQSAHPILDAYLARMPVSIIETAGLFYFATKKTGPLSVEVMSDAIDVCRFFAVAFENAVVPVPEMPEGERFAWTVRRALHGHVDKQTEIGAKQPFRIAFSTLCNKARSIGLSQVQLRHGVAVMQQLGWVRIVPDGLDQMIEMDQHVFDRTNRQ
ncbi:hypothetical protein [Ralstonia insidiosa]|uniref:hypothetical protein n=1 Tax=Ralstonia insidiosa TaxID=190721 RepID=UPI000CEEF6F7|nr:hypothetical protein [Ralstonia insidiosa]